jgi:hypothetical protein
VTWPPDVDPSEEESSSQKNASALFKKVGALFFLLLATGESVLGVAAPSRQPPVSYPEVQSISLEVPREEEVAAGRLDASAEHWPEDDGASEPDRMWTVEAEQRARRKAQGGKGPPSGVADGGTDGRGNSEASPTIGTVLLYISRSLARWWRSLRDSWEDWSVLYELRRKGSGDMDGESFVEAHRRMAQAELHKAGSTLPVYLRLAVPGLLLGLVLAQAATNPNLFDWSGLARLTVFGVCAVIAHRLSFGGAATDARRGVILLTERIAGTGLVAAGVAVQASLVFHHSWRFALAVTAALLLLGPFVGWKRSRTGLNVGRHTAA